MLPRKHANKECHNNTHEDNYRSACRDNVGWDTVKIENNSFENLIYNNGILK